MPISGPSSYIPTANEFIAHWKLADTAHSSSIAVKGGVIVDLLEDLVDELGDKQETLVSKLNQREFARGNIKVAAEALVARLERFRNVVQALYDNGPYIEALPTVPNPESARGKVVQPMIDAKDIWGNINDGVNDLVLSGGYTLLQFTTALDELEGFYKSFEESLSEEKYARSERNSSQDAIYPVLKNYRQIVQGLFNEGSATYESLPRLTPLPGSTPDAVNASAIWDATAQQASIAWGISDNAALKEYQVRYTPGSKYVEDDASVVANVQPGQPPQLLTLDGLTQPGATATYKVFVITETGNEAGSEALSVTRPTE